MSGLAYITSYFQVKFSKNKHFKTYAGALYMTETTLMGENALYHGTKEAIERHDTCLDDDTRCAGVLCRLKVVHRAALRLEAVSDRWRCRTRKVEPGNEPEGGRALAGTLASGLCCVLTPL